MFKISSDDVTKYLRIAIYWAMGSLGYSGFINGSMGQMLVSGALTLALFLWTLYAGRIAAKINSLLNSNVIEILVTKDAATANAVDSNKVVSVQDVANPTVATSTPAVAVIPAASANK